MGVIVKNKVTYGGAGSIITDTALSTESTNPVQNKVVTEAINEINDNINGVTDSIADVDAKATEATNIAKGRNQAHVFATTADMEAWLSNADNIGLFGKSDNIYIVELEVPDWWIAEVLEEADPDTGYYYKINQLETQKVDLTNYIAKSDDVLLYRGDISGDDWALVQIGVWNTKVANETYGIPGWSTIHKTGNSSFTGSFLNCYASGSQRGIYAFDGTTNTFVKLPRQDEIDAIIDSITSVRNLKTYTSVVQLGLTQDNTLDEIFSAMSQYSQLVALIAQGKSLSGTLPNSNTAELVITKGNAERGVAILTQYQNGVVRKNNCYGGTWQGWETIISQSELDEITAIRNVQTYSSLSQLGLSFDNTIKEVMRALPINSELIQNTSATENNFTANLPNGAEAGEVRFCKGGASQRGFVEFKSYAYDRVYVNRFYDNVFKGWRKVSEQSDLDKKMNISGGETTGQMQFVRNLGATNVSYSQAGVSMIAPTNESPESRAGIGFTNEGSNGAYLYLDIDGKLKFIDDQGVIKVITTTTQT